MSFSPSAAMVGGVLPRGQWEKNSFFLLDRTRENLQCRRQRQPTQFPARIFFFHSNLDSILKNLQKVLDHDTRFGNVFAPS